MNEDFVSVSSLNEYVKNYLDNNKILNNIRVRGEVLNIKTYPTSQYFTIKDEKDARISVVMFFRGVAKMKEKLKDGDDVIISGQVTLYTKGGTYQLIANDVEYYGEGAKLLALKKLREKLAAEGLFEPSKKKKIPRFATRIGVICGKDSAAWADIKENIARRYPLAQLYYYPSLVQGNEAPKSIIQAFLKSEKQDLDVLIIARGGGSSDDLWAFNDEELVLTLAKRRTPLISAVGHEVDTTLVDYVSDLRVSTPTAAAEHAVENQIDLLQNISINNERIHMAIKQRINTYEEKIRQLSKRPVLTSPQNIVVPYQTRINDLNLRIKAIFEKTYLNHSKKVSLELERLKSASRQMLFKYNEQFHRLNAGLHALSPLNVLERGYAIILDGEGQVVKDVDNLSPGALIEARMYKQSIVATVKEKTKDE